MRKLMHVLLRVLALIDRGLGLWTEGLQNTEISPGIKEPCAIVESKHLTIPHSRVLSPDTEIPAVNPGLVRHGIRTTESPGLLAEDAVGSIVRVVTTHATTPHLPRQV